MKPNHVAVIMDGNGRWAKERGLGRSYGHLNGAEAVRKVVRHARRLEIPWLTLFAFSSMNWGRPTREVSDLMELLLDFLFKERSQLLENDIRLTAIGEREYLPKAVRAALAQVESDTAHCRSMTLVLAVSYDGRRDLVQAARRIAELAARGELLPADIMEPTVMGALSTADQPDVDLLIRTSGELRLSGFLPLEACYAELVFVDKKWPEFVEADFDAALHEFACRKRRFGLIDDQIQSAPA